MGDVSRSDKHLAAKVSWSDLCPACKGYPDQGHRYDATCKEERPAAHVHEWEPVGMTTERRLVSDGRRDRFVTLKLAIRSCKCGAIRRTEVARV